MLFLFVFHVKLFMYLFLFIYKILITVIWLKMFHVKHNTTWNILKKGYALGHILNILCTYDNNFNISSNSTAALLLSTETMFLQSFNLSITSFLIVGLLLLYFVSRET